MPAGSPHSQAFELAAVDDKDETAGPEDGVPRREAWADVRSSQQGQRLAADAGLRNALPLAVAVGARMTMPFAGLILSAWADVVLTPGFIFEGTRALFLALVIFPFFDLHAPLMQWYTSWS